MWHGKLVYCKWKFLLIASILSGLVFQLLFWNLLQDDPQAHEKFTAINKAYEVLKGRLSMELVDTCNLVI